MIPSTARRWSLTALAEALAATWRGDAEAVIDHAGDLESSGETGLAALYDKRRLQDALESRACVFVVSEEVADAFGDRNLIVSPAPKATFARAVALIHPEREIAPGVHPTAVVDPKARLGEDVSIGPQAVIERDVVVGDRAVVGAGAIVLEAAELGSDVRIHPRAVIYPRTIVGARSAIFAGAVVGAPGFGHAADERGNAVRVPHLGRVVLGEDVEIGANATVDRATFGQTRLENRARIDNLVQIGHNAWVGEDAMIAAQSGLSGSSRLGRGVVVGGQSGLADHVSVGDGSAVAAKTAVLQDVGEGEYVAGIPALKASLWRRIALISAKLPQLWTDVRRLKEKVEGENE